MLLSMIFGSLKMILKLRFCLMKFRVLVDFYSKINEMFMMMGEIVKGRLIIVCKMFLLWNWLWVSINVVVILKIMFSGIMIVIISSDRFSVDIVVGVLI